MSILWNPGEATVVEKVSLPVITTGAQNMGDGIYWLKAGTPLDEDLAVANNGDAMYIVAEDFFFVSTNPNQERMVPLIKAGYVDLNKAEAASGLTYTDAAVAALKEAGIEVVDGLLETGGGSGGGGVVTAKVTKSGLNYSADISYADLRAAYEAGNVVQLDLNGSIYSLADVRSEHLIFDYMESLNSRYVLEYNSYGLTSIHYAETEFVLCTYYASLEGGTYTLDSDADSISSNVNSGFTVIFFMTDANGVTHACHVVSMKSTPIGDDYADYSYAFYVVVNGSIVAFTAASGSDNPTYTP